MKKELREGGSGKAPEGPAHIFLKHLAALYEDCLRGRADIVLEK